MNARKRAFVREYLVSGNATQAAIRAGYSPKSAHSCGPRLMENADVRAAIADGQKVLEQSGIASAEERRAFWTAMMRDLDAPAVARLRASELLGKNQGDFVERHELAGSSDAPLRIVFRRKGEP